MILFFNLKNKTQKNWIVFFLFQYRIKTEAPTESNYIDLPETYPETLLQKGNKHISNDSRINHIGGIEEQLAVLLTSEVTTEMETTSSTTTTTTTTLAPISNFLFLLNKFWFSVKIIIFLGYCVVQRAHQSDQFIAEGQSQRVILFLNIQSFCFFHFIYF